jgi:hypothetical protein
MFSMAGVTIAQVNIQTWTISPGALQNRLGEPAKITITIGGNGGNNVSYSGDTGGSEGNVGNILNLMNNGQLKNNAGQSIIFPQAKIVNGEVQITTNNIIKIKGNVTIDDVPNPLPPPLGPILQVAGDLEVGGLLTGLDAYGDEADYFFELGYGDETGTTTSLAQVNLMYSDLTDQTISGLLTTIYSGLEVQLPSALQSDLTLDSADNALYFVFPTSIENPTVEGYSTDAGLTYNDSMELTPEPGTFMLLGCGLVTLAGVLRRKLSRG